MDFTSLGSGLIQPAIWAGAVVVFLILLRASNIFRYIPNNQVGIVEKLWTTKGSISEGFIALNGEAGYEPEVLRGGLHVFFPFMYRIHNSDLVTVGQGKIAYVFARDGTPLGASQVLGANDTEDKSDFQNARRFLLGGGQKGPQRKILREGAYAINLAQFVVVTKDRTFALSLDKAEEALRAALRACGVAWTELPGEGAFYGPKIEYHMKDSLGRAWQVGTMQVDFSMPGRLGAEYVGEDSQRHVPVMLHRAIVGSMERFIGILIEHHAGAFPAWLAPVQAVVMNITDGQADFVNEVAQTLVAQGFRVEADLRNEKIGYKIREHTLEKVPYLLVVGDRERETGTVSVRARSGEDLGSMSIADFAKRLDSEGARP